MNVGNRPALIPYESEDGSLKLDVQLDGETVWLSQDQIAALFSTSIQNVAAHIKNVYAEGELNDERTFKKILKVVDNGRNYPIKHYNLDVVISVGYRINSATATRFRQWATQTLKEYMVKGFVMDDQQKSARRWQNIRRRASCSINQL